MRRVLLVALVLGACGGDDAPPVEVGSGRLTARIEPSPARVVLLVDGEERWSTQQGGQARGAHDPPLGFAAIGSRAGSVESMFGSFKFTEATESEKWQTVDALGKVTVTGDRATFTLLHDGDEVGTGTLELDALHARISLATDAQRIQIAAPIDDEHLVGLGGQSFDIDHRGETVPLFVQEDGIGKFDDPDDTYTGVWFLTGRKHSTHTPMPMLLSSNGYALAVKTDARAIFALGPEAHPDVARYETWEGNLDLNIFLGDGANQPSSALGAMITWVGKPARPPLSIFAPWVDAIYGSVNVRRVAQKLRTLGIPASAIWTEDWRGGTDGATGYALDEDWRVDRGVYPDFETLANDLHGLGFAFLTYHNSFIDDTADIHAEAVQKGYAIGAPAGGAYEFTSITLTGTSTLLDLTNPAAVTWAKGVMGEAVTLGADGWMADFAEWQPHDAVLSSGEDALAVHNRYTVDWIAMTSEILAPRAGRFDPIHFIRSAWIGSQKYAQVIWPGDQQTDFSAGDGLPSVIPMGINLGLAGFPYFGSDVAGYMSQGTDPTTEELFFRWTSFGALQPVMRTHHGRSARENWQWESSTASEQHFRRWARFHMQLAAYFTGLVSDFERDGLPLMRMIALGYPDEDWAWSITDQYLLGDRLLVAPVQTKAGTSRGVQLPPGKWFPLSSSPVGSAPVEGMVTATATIAEIPFYAREGSILVLYPDGIDTPLPTSAQPALTTTADVGGDREVWLFSGTAHAADGTWDDEQGSLAGTKSWQWSGRSVGALPTGATFKGAAAPLTIANGVASVTIVGDGTLSFAGGGELVIARGDATASVTVRLR